MPHRLFGVLLLGLITACSAESPPPDAAPAETPAYTAGKDYFPIEPPQPTTTGDAIEVVEVFGYTCVHCANFEPMVSEWKAKLPSDVQFEYMPAAFGGAWEAFARAYYTAETMGLLERTHDAMFRAIHEERRQFRSLEDIAAFYADYGVSTEQFLATMQSFPVETKLAQSRERIKAYGVDGTPTMIVDGKYRVPPTQGFEHMLQVAEHLIQRERQAASTAAR